MSWESEFPIRETSNAPHSSVVVWASGLTVSMEMQHVSNLAYGLVSGEMTGIRHCESGDDCLYDEANKILTVFRVAGDSVREMEDALLRMIIQYSPETIRFDEVSPGVKRVLSWMISRNHPGLEIVRLNPGNDLLNLNYQGVKIFNRQFGFEAYDDFRATFVGCLARKLDAYNSIHQMESGRLIRSDYKNISITDPNGSGLERFLSLVSEEDRNVLLDEVFAAHREKIIELAKRSHISPDELESQIRRVFRFSVGYSHVLENADDEALIRAFYEAEMSSRGIKPIPGEKRNLNFEWIQKRIATEIFQVEKNFATMYGSDYFRYGDLEYPMVVTLQPQKEKIIHPVLLQAVRKEEDIGLDSGVISGVQEYIDKLNGWFDFIAPVRDFANDLQKARRIDADFHGWTVRAEDILKNYKGTYTPEALFSMAEGQKGMNVFIDIIGMGILNLASFRTLARKLERGECSFEDLIGAWGDVTEQFIDFVSDLEKKFPEAKISLGGDEVYMHIPEMGQEDAYFVLTEIGRSLTDSGLHGRIAHSFQNEKIRDVFYDLNSLTDIPKKIEKTIPDKNIHIEVLDGIPRDVIMRTLDDASAKTFLKDLGPFWRQEMRIFLPEGEEVCISVNIDSGLYLFTFGG